MLATDLPPIAAINEPVPIVRRLRDRGSSSITPELAVITSLTNGRSIKDLRRERLATNAIDQLQRYGRFRAGWDGYRAKTFSEELIAQGIGIVRMATALSEWHGSAIDAIIPGPAGDGSIDIEFRLGERTLIVTMYPDAPTAQVYRLSDRHEDYSDVRNGALAMVPQLAWLFS